MSAAPIFPHERCAGSVCHIGSVTNVGCPADRPCPLTVLALRGVLQFGAGAPRSINIPSHEWASAAGELVAHRDGKIWRILGFIDRPAVLLEMVNSAQRETIVMSSERAKDWHRMPLPAVGAK